MKRKKIGMLKQIILVSLVLQAIYANTFLGKVIDAKTGMPIIVGFCILSSDFKYNLT